MKIPQKIDPCPIVESLCEIRFQPSYPSDAIFGLIYKSMKDDFDSFEKLPILDIPETIRSSDKQLEYKPYYKLTKENYLLQIGPKVFSFAVMNNYVGWDIFHKQIFKYIRRLLDLEIISNIERAALRYINFFEFNIYEESTLSIYIGKTNYKDKRSNLLMEIEEESVLNVLRLSNNANIKNRKGSAIDIDTIYNLDLSNFQNSFEKIINQLHFQEKKLFFSLLKEEYLENLNPQY